MAWHDDMYCTSLLLTSLSLDSRPLFEKERPGFKAFVSKVGACEFGLTTWL